MKFNFFQYSRLIFGVVFFFVLFSSFAQSPVVNTSGSLPAISSGSRVFYAQVILEDSNPAFQEMLVVSEGDIASWGDYGPGLEFTLGSFRVRNGGYYDDFEGFGCQFNELYEIWFELDFESKTYDAYIKREIDLVPILIGEDLAFRNVSMSALDTWSLIYNPAVVNNEGAALEIKSFGLVLDVGMTTAMISESALSALESNVGVMEPSFSPIITRYTLWVPESTQLITLSGSSSNSNTEVTGLGQVDISGYELGAELEPIEIKVLSENDIQTTYRIDLQFSSALSTKSQSIDPVLVAPNPVGNRLTVNGVNEVLDYKVRICDLEGKILIERAETSLDVSMLPAGIYMLIIEQGDGLKYSRFIKQ